MAAPGEALTALIVDNGTENIKAGFGGEDAPRLEMPNVVGRPRHPGVNGVVLGCNKDNFIGNEATSKRGLLEMSNPVVRGSIANWQDMQEVWQSVLFDGLMVACEEHPLLITESPDNTRADREKMAQVMFEVFNCPALVVSNASVLSLFATGRSTGVVVDSGAGRTHIGPVWEGYSLPHFVRRIDHGGKDMTDYVKQLLRAEGYPFSTAQDEEHACAIKEELCYVCENSEKELKYSSESRNLEKLYKLPDGQPIYMNKNRFMAPEALFSPEPLKNSSFTQGWHEMVHESIQCCDANIQSELYGSVVLAGGNTLFPRLEERMQREVSLLAPKGSVTKCVAFPDRKFAAWSGGSILGSLSTFPCMWVSKNEYDDYGASIIHRKC